MKPLTSFTNIIRLSCATALLSIVTIVNSGCTAALVGAAAVATVDVLHDRRTVGNYIDDNSVEMTLRQRYLRDPDIRQTSHVSVTAMNGVVLLTGEVPNDDLRSRTIDHTRDLTEVRQVLDEIRIAGKAGLGSRVNDSWITSKVKSQLIAATQMDASRVKVVTEYGNVYLMGLVTRAEADVAAETARNVIGVSRVVKVFEYIN